MICDMAIELQGTGVYAINLHPGPVETETTKELVGSGESLYFAGRCLVKLLQDSEYLSSQHGRVLLTGEISSRYNIEDVNGSESTT